MRIRRGETKDIPLLAELWKRSVESTHTFITAEDISKMYPEVLLYLKQITVYIAEDAKQMLGFIGSSNQHIDMLFVDDVAIGKGVGGKLIDYLLLHHVDVKTLDVNEDNPEALSFYKYKGFTVVSRSETDDAGRPFPILHMERKKL